MLFCDFNYKKNLINQPLHVRLCDLKNRTTATKKFSSLWRQNLLNSKGRQKGDGGVKSDKGATKRRQKGVKRAEKGRKKDDGGVKRRQGTTSGKRALLSLFCRSFGALLALFCRSFGALLALFSHFFLRPQPYFL